jgi:RHS repeat-associated protein
LRFPGQWADSSCGLYYNHHRYYDPHSGRYTSPDPIGLRGGIDPYAYVPDPTREADPTGLKKCTPKDILDEAYDYSRGACEQRARNMLNAIMNDLHPDDVNRAAIVRLDSTADAIAARTRNMPGGNNNRLLDLATGVWEREGGFHNVVVVDTDQGWFVLDPMVSRENWLPYGEYFGHTGYVDTAGARYVPGYFFDDSPLMPGGPPVEIEWETVPRDP